MQPGAVDLLLAFAVLAGAARAQDIAVLQQGDVHVQVSGGFNFVGGVNRISTTTVSPGLTPATYLTPNTNGVIALQADVHITRRLAIAVDYSYLAGGSLVLNQDYIIQESPPRTRRVALDAHSKAHIIGTSILLRFPIQRAPKLVPYASVGAALNRTSFGLSQAVIGSETGGTFSGSSIANDVGGSGVAGARYYFTERLGLAADVRIVAGPGFRTIGRFAVGLFVKAH